jgi:uncharacterized protein GlcG (DUF336 family)
MNIAIVDSGGNLFAFGGGFPIKVKDQFIVGASA